MTTLTDEVARAIHPIDSGHPEWPEWDQCADWWKDQKLRQARAAIAVFVEHLRSDPVWAEAVKGHGPGIDTFAALATHIEDGK